MATATDADLYRFSPEAYHRLVESGGLHDDTHVELIDGLIVGMSPRTPAHEYALQWLDEVVQRAVDHARWKVRVAMALSLGSSEPEPDLAVVAADAPRPYHPASAALVIEVALSSLRRDLMVKPRIYADADIPLYWVIDLDGRRAVVHERPGPQGYGKVEQREVLEAPQLGLEPIRLADVLAAAGR